MKCPRCIYLVQEILITMALPAVRVGLGEVMVAATEETIDWPQLADRLRADGFELIHPISSQARLVEQIKTSVQTLLRTEPERLRSGQALRELSQQLNRRTNYLSESFSAAEGTTLEQYIIAQRVALAAELLTTTPLSVSRIAQQLGYSSLGHLSRQFRQLQGTTPSRYRTALMATQ